MAAGKSSRVNRKYKTKYRIRNWREYERGLRSRGDVTIWLSEEAIAAWTPAKNGLRGGQRRYSNLAILTALTLRVVFHLPLRQTEGFLDSLLSWMGLNLKAPDHTTLSRRNQIVEVPPLTRAHDGPIHLIVDSTGLKILGCGEWNAHKYQASKNLCIAKTPSGSNWLIFQPDVGMIRQSCWHLSFLGSAYFSYFLVAIVP